MSTSIGLDIGSSAVRAAQVKHGRRGSMLEKIGEVALPPGAVQEGEIVDRDAVVDALKRLWHTHRIRTRKVSVGLANQQVVVRRLELPYLTESELRSTLALQVDGQIPISVDHAVMDFCILGEQQDAAGNRQIRILLVAAQVDTVNALLEVVKAARLQPVSVDLDVFAALRSLAPPNLFAESISEMLVDIGSTVTDIAVHYDGAPHFARTLPFGGSSITAGLMEELDLDRDEAERAKAAVDGAELSDAQRAAVDVEVEAYTQRLIAEIRSSIDYCSSQRDIPAVGRLVLTGGSSLLPGLPDKLAGALGLDITTGSPFATLAGSDDRSTQQVPDADAHMAVAVGLALGAAS